jgi:transposase
MEEGETKTKKQSRRKPKKTDSDATEKMEEKKRTKKQEAKPIESIQCKVGTFYIQF